MLDLVLPIYLLWKVCMSTTNLQNLAVHVWLLVTKIQSEARLVDRYEDVYSSRNQSKGFFPTDYFVFHISGAAIS